MSKLAKWSDFMSTLGSRIKDLRIEQRLTGAELGKILGVSKATISLYEHDKSTPDDNIKIKICTHFGVSFDWLMGLTKDKAGVVKEKGVRIPVLGRIVAGIPIEAIEDVIDWEEIPISMARTGDYFALMVTGRSMEPTLRDGDVVILKKQSDVDNGDIAAVLINGNEATIKEIKKGLSGITLIGHNVVEYSPTFYSNEDIERLPISILGKAVELRRKF